MADNNGNDRIIVIVNLFFINGLVNPQIGTEAFIIYRKDLEGFIKSKTKVSGLFSISVNVIPAVDLTNIKIRAVSEGAPE